MGAALIAIFGVTFWMLKKHQTASLNYPHTIQLGALMVPEVRTFSIPVKNNTDRVVHLREKGTCKCTHISNPDITIPAHATRTVTGSYDNSGRSGEHSIWVMLFQDDQKNPKIVNIKVNDLIECPEFVDLGYTRQGEKKTTRIAVLRRPKMPILDVYSVEYDKAVLDVNWHHNNQGDVQLQLSPVLKRTGKFATSITLSTNDACQPKKHVAILGEIYPALMSEPDDVSLGIVHAGDVIQQSLAITSPYGRRFSITSTRSSIREVRITCDNQLESTTHKLSLSYQIPTQIPAISGNIFVWTSTEEAPLVVPIHGLIE